MALTGTQRAVTTARAGAARAGATRFGFAPKDTKGPKYVWRRLYPSEGSWTPVTR